MLCTSFSYIIETSAPFQELRFTALLSAHKYTALKLLIFKSTLHTNIKLNVKLNSKYFEHTKLSHASHYIENYFPARKAVKLLRTVRDTPRMWRTRIMFSSGSQKLLNSSVRSEMKYNCLPVYSHWCFERRLLKNGATVAKSTGQFSRLSN